MTSEMVRDRQIKKRRPREGVEFFKFLSNRENRRAS